MTYSHSHIWIGQYKTSYHTILAQKLTAASAFIRMVKCHRGECGDGPSTVLHHCVSLCDLRTNALSMRLQKTPEAALPDLKFHRDYRM